MKKTFEVCLDNFDETGETVSKKSLKAAVTWDSELGDVLEIKTDEMQCILIPLQVLKQQIKNYESSKEE